MLVIYGSRQQDRAFEYFEAINQEDNKDMVICDIDASYCNDTKLPQIPNELMATRILTLLKNTKANQYDLAYESDIEPQKDHVKSIRQQFFQILKPFIINLPKYIGKGNTFYNYFDTEGYLEQFDGLAAWKEFALELLKSSQFIHLCDDSENEDYNNFMMLNAIFSQTKRASTDPLPSFSSGQQPKSGSNKEYF